MSELVERMQQDLTQAMKARDQVRVAALRMALAAVKEAAVAGKEAKDLSDADVEQVLRTQVKRRDEAAEAFQAGGREEQAQRELDERAILSAYLPEELDEGDLEALVQEAADQKGWLIAYGHDVSDSPTPYGCTSHDLDRLIRLAKEADLDILPVHAAWTRIN